LAYVAGSFYVTDNEAVRRITPAGMVTRIAGEASAIGSDDGVGAAARFTSPDGIAGDAAGYLYVADSENNTIRKLVWSR
jgi:sugar lactone lactonase YvrE